MNSCKICSKTFKTHQALNAHMVAHKKDKRYSVSRKDNIKNNKTFNCLYCGTESKWSRSSNNKFCSVECSAKYVWETVSVPKIKKGLGGNTKRYLRETVGDFCAICGQGNNWNNQPLTLQLDHIDGNSDNNNLTNLRLLCPNCHTQTKTYGSRGKGTRYKKYTKRNQYLREYKNRK